MPVQQINVKNTSEIENFEWTMTPFTQNVRGDGVRVGSSSSQTSYSNSSGDICRICHCESDAQNPLLAPCYCSGSLKYVHQSCLQQWLTASETRSCELCKFHFIMHTKIKPFNEWRLLEMSGVERRRLCCAVLFHCVAALCVMWSLFVLIERAVEEVNRGLIAWPFWTKLVVVAVGFTGGAVFMYIQCRQYLHLCNRWRSHNRILLIQNAPEKLNIQPPSPILQHVPIPTERIKRERERTNQDQVVANIENDPQIAADLRSNIQQLHVEQHPLPEERPQAAVSPRESTVYTEEDESGGFETYKFNPYRRVSSVNENKLYLSGSSDQNTQRSRVEYPENRRYSDTRIIQAFDSRHLATFKPLDSYNSSVPTDPLTGPPKSAQSNQYQEENASTSRGYLPNKKVYHISNKFEPAVSLSQSYDVHPQVSDIIFEVTAPEIDPLEFNIREMLELDQSTQLRKKSVLSLNRDQSAQCHKPYGGEMNKAVFKSLPNLSASSENLLPQKPNS